ncbi:MAG TPA: glutamate--tRNA ligase family protein [Acidobacteriaceae bacterium]|nr:glutamate--tRNA ligase family protein [Acidobacteriaceae bacterium]
MTYRGRIAPSPTGLLHLGHARTFFTAYLRATEAHGTLVLRNEDLDPHRSRPDFAVAMIEDLRWLGIRWQEGPDVGGPFVPYAQSQRRERYLAVWRQLLAAGFLYPCACSRRELARIAEAPHESGQHESSSARFEADETPMYAGTCRPGPGSPPATGCDAPAGVNWRFRVPEGEAIEFEDRHFGPQRLVAGFDFGDFPVWRRDDVPAYQLAVVADDHEMQITEVVRGADLLLSTARQILICRALGWNPPQWYHCPLVLDERGERLAKRHDALSIRSLRAQGEYPENLVGDL